MKKLLSLLVLLLLVGCQSSKPAEQAAESGKESGKKVKVGIVQFMDHVSLDAAREGFVEQLKESGIDAEVIEQSANGDMSLTNTIAQSLKADGVDLIYAIATPAAQAAKNTVTDIPIVFSSVTDPVGAELVKTFEKPDSNVTGVSDYVSSEAQIDSFLKIYPDVKTFGVIYNTSEQNSLVQIEELKNNLAKRGIKLETVGVSAVTDIPQAVASIAPKIDALFALTDNLVANAAPIVSDTLIKSKLPSLSAEEGQVKNGLLMSEGVNYKEQGKQAGRMAVKILNGEQVANIPVELNEVNTKLVNVKTAEALGVDLNAEGFKDVEKIQ
ncbi:ABC transporter substrate-binding protein [Peptoniphilus indolicus]|uniref:ABC superfamily ATP binding cassette transporter, binding protein n=2 Tax=Peptoniphilus indolicus TaxID=33030 RepID=G4D3N9_9FIRM|nr:ABC transporter substrate-binding protein [Peptoniphilus indolicus]EGY79860.1 ABC superfamily ATP binding cassette transporter, binding protein [Peptoniphilus indolicus ATCC 29427]SUB75714.1 ABC-type uncharacterized transport system, periplasmic component [Peptoniphilus indolicus]